MSWWDFLSDFIQIISSILGITLFSADTGNGVVVTLSLGDMLIGLLVSGALLFYFIPRR